MLSDKHKRPRPISGSNTSEPTSSSSSSSHQVIQPLRDLARNFDIDIEPYLQEYLHYESSLNQDYDDDDNGNNNNNNNTASITQFANAALKIQNSTSIYTRKVDFLHRVVYEAHEALHEFVSNNGNNTNTKRKGVRSKLDNDADIAEFLSADPDMEFMLLDDVLPVDHTGKSIDLRNSRTIDNVDSTDTTLHRHDTTINNNNNNNNVTLLSLGGIMSTTRNNDTFISRDSLHTSTAAVSRMLLQNLNGYNGGGGSANNNGSNAMYRLLNSDVDSNGALIMPGAKKGVFVNGELMSPEHHQLCCTVMNDDDDVGENVQIFPGGLSPQQQRQHCNDEEFVGGYNNNDDDDFGGDDGVGFELYNEHEEEPTEIITEESTKDQEQPSNNNVQTKKKHDDPWEALDPHQPSKDRIKPLKIGVTFRLPPGLEGTDRPSACVTGSRTRKNNVKGNNKKDDQTSLERQRQEEMMGQWHISPFVTDWSDPVTASAGDDEANDDDKKRSDLDWMFRINDGIYGEEFAYVAKRYAKHYDAIARRKRRLEREGKALLEDDDPMNGEGADHQINNYDDYGGGGFDYGDDDDDSYGNYDDAVVDNPENDNQGNRSNVDFAAIDDVFTSAGMNYDDGDNDDVDYNHSQLLSFEELCQAHLRKFAKSAEIYAAETQLTKRVGAWQAGLAPILEEQETRPEFDIHSLGRQILESVEDKLTIKKRTVTGEKKLDAPSSGLGDTKSNIIGFRQISQDKEEYEVCRLFLSTLMLCNCGNLIVHDGNDVSSTESLQIELLNSKFEAIMDEFLAPSVQEESGLPGMELNTLQEDHDSCDLE